MESSTQPCTQLPQTPTRDQSQQSSWVWGFFFPLSTRRKETCNTFPHYIFRWRQISLMMQRQIWRQDFALPSTSAPTVPQRKEKTETFLLSSSWFPLPLLLTLTLCWCKDSHSSSEMQLDKSRTCRCGPLKKTRGLLQHSWMAFLTAEPHHHGNKQCPHGAFS